MLRKEILKKGLFIMFTHPFDAISRLSPARVLSSLIVNWQ